MQRHLKKKGLRRSVRVREKPCALGGTEAPCGPSEAADDQLAVIFVNTVTPPVEVLDLGTTAICFTKNLERIRLVDLSRTQSGTFLYRSTLSRKWLAKITLDCA